MFNGFWPLESTVVGTVILRGPSNQPVDPDIPPVYRVYSQAGMMTGMYGNMTQVDTGTITNATNATPIVITTSTAHHRQTGDYVVVSSVGGNTAANGTWQVTVLTSSTYSLDGSVGNSGYTLGGAWHQAGVYQYSFVAGVANGFSDSQTYMVTVNYTYGSLPYVDCQTFIVT